MGEDHVALRPSDRAIEQAIVALKKGAHLLKYSRNGKPKFCPFRLSMDEKYLIWYSGQEEQQLRLSSVVDIIRGQNSRQFQTERESQSFSLIYANGERSLHLICKDKAQADSWFLGLKAIISRTRHCKLFSTVKTHRGAQSCISSPASFMRRKQILGLSGETNRSAQVHSVSGSPTKSFSERCFSDGLSCSSDSFYSESSLSSMHNVVDMLTPSSPYFEPDDLNLKRVVCANGEPKRHILVQTPGYESPRSGINVLRDILIWGEGTERGYFVGGEGQSDALLPKVLDSAMMLDVQSISLGAKHAALSTKQGEVFCWGEGKRGRLGHKLDIDATCPKIVDSLTGIFIESVSCGEYQTCALSNSGELYTWGDSGCCSDLEVADRRPSHWLPYKLSGCLEGVSIVSVACGEWHTGIVSSTGQLFTFGDGTFGVLGHGNLVSISHPKEVELLRGLWVKSVACGPWHTAAVVDIMNDCSKPNSKCGKLFTWGDGDKGRLGHSDQERKFLPTCVAELVDHDFVQVSCGRMLTVGVTNMGKVYAMGSAVHGQLGNPEARDKSITVVQGKLKDEYVKQISAGSYHIAALTSMGNVFTWGRGANGQLGLGDTRDRNTPTLVEFLRDRKVEHISCGSSCTAAICLHKSIVTTDQLACKGCGMAFGFTRKKQNCYNCGLLFCRACCSKKVTNASLAPNKIKPFRVCDPCFKKLQRVAVSSELFKTEIRTPRPLMIPQRGIYDENHEKGEGITTRSRIKLSRNYLDEQNNWVKQPTDSASSMLVGLQRWGQVSCPELFRTDSRDQSMLSSETSLRDQLLPLSPVSFTELPSTLKSQPSTAINEERDLAQSDEFLNEEVQKLRAEVENLKRLSQTRTEKIRECHQKTEEAWSLAKEEARKSKAAKEVIKALTSRLHEMSENLSAGRDARDQASTCLVQITSRKANTDEAANDSVYTMSVRAESPASMKDFYPVVAKRVCPEAGLIEDRKVESLCSSPIVFSNTLKYLRDRELKENTTSRENACNRQVDSGQVGKVLKQEWVEQYQSGVYITFMTLPNGKKGLRRVRFSRKKFTETEAARWWDENQHLVYEKYDINEYTASDRDMIPT